MGQMSSHIFNNWLLSDPQVADAIVNPPTTAVEAAVAVNVARLTTDGSAPCVYACVWACV